MKTEGSNDFILYEKVYDFSNLYKAHKLARRGKQANKEVIEFEMNLSENLIKLSDELKDGSYRISGYYSFYVHDPKTREIHALHYRDRVVQHALCDEIVGPILDSKLIYDNAACRIGKGNHFALKRVSQFLQQYYKCYGCEGYFLKCDIRKFFDNIDHQILKDKLSRVFHDTRTLSLLFHVIDSYEKFSGIGLPLGNQTSQWFALYYLDGLDRLVKEKLQIKYYSRYMDDCILICPDKTYLKYCLKMMTQHVENDLQLQFNEKTQISPIKNGVNYLGFHFYLTESGKVIRTLKRQTKRKYQKKLKYMKTAYAENQMQAEEIRQVICSYHVHMKHGHTYQLRKKLMSEFILNRKE